MLNIPESDMLSVKHDDWRAGFDQLIQFCHGLEGRVDTAMGTVGLKNLSAELTAPGSIMYPDIPLHRHPEIHRGSIVPCPAEPCSSV